MFKDIFVNCLQRKKITLYRVWKDAKIPKTTVYEWAAGTRVPVSEDLVKLADYLGVSIDYLAGRTDKPEINK